MQNAWHANPEGEEKKTKKKKQQTTKLFQNVLFEDKIKKKSKGDSIKLART